MTYDLTGHPLLSAPASALSAEELDAWTLAAVYVLGFMDVTFDDPSDSLNAAEIALTLTVNASVSQASEDTQGRVVESESKGDQSFTYKTAADGRQMVVPVRAQAIADALTRTVPLSAVVTNYITW